MFDYSLEIISLTRILLDLGDEAMTGSLTIENHPPLWINEGSLVLKEPWNNLSKLVPLFSISSGSVKFIECELIDELQNCPVKTLESCIFEGMRQINIKDIQDKLPDTDTKLKTTDDFRGTIQFTRTEQLIYEEIDKQSLSCQTLAKKFKSLKVSLEQIRVIVYRFCVLNLIQEVHELETVAAMGQIKSVSPKPSFVQIIGNQMRLGLPIVGLVFLWLFNVLGNLELKTIGFFQRTLTLKETLNNIVTIEVEPGEDPSRIEAALDLIPPTSTTSALFPSTMVEESIYSKLDYVGFSDDSYEAVDSGKILDTSRIIDSDGVERRLLIGQEIDQDFRYSFWSKLALERLKTLGVSPQWHDSKFLFSLSNTPLSPLSYGNVLYPREDIQGYQILASSPVEIETVSLNSLLAEPEEYNLASKIVIFGLEQNGEQNYSHLQFAANATNQILLAGTYGRQPIKVASRWYSIIFSFFLWAIVLALALKIRNTPNKYLKFTLLLISIFLSYGVATLSSFFLGTWYGFSYPTLAAVLALGSSLCYKPKLAASYIDRESSLLSNKGFFDTITKLLDLQFDNVEGSTLYLIGISNYDYLTDSIDPKKLISDILLTIKAVLEHFQISDYTVGRLNSNRLGLLVPALDYNNSCLIKGRFIQMFAKLTKQFKGVSPKLSIGMAIFDGENYISPVELVATADSDSDYSRSLN